MATTCPYCFQINPTGRLRCMYCGRYVDDDADAVTEEMLMSPPQLDYKRGIKLDVKISDRNDLSSEQFKQVAKYIIFTLAGLLFAALILHLFS